MLNTTRYQYLYLYQCSYDRLKDFFSTSSLTAHISQLHLAPLLRDEPSNRVIFLRAHYWRPPDAISAIDLSLSPCLSTVRCLNHQQSPQSNLHRRINMQLTDAAALHYKTNHTQIRCSASFEKERMNEIYILHFAVARYSSSYREYS